MGGLVAALLFDSALVWPLVHNKGRLEEMTDTFLAAGEMGVLLFFTVKENSIMCVYSSVCSRVCSRVCSSWKQLKEISEYF